MADICPYYHTDYKKCEFFGTTQEGSHKENRCLHKDGWKSCINYTNRSYDEKVSKRLRPNPDL